MDSLTQAVLGGSITGVALHRFLGRKSVLLGAALATLPDLDVFVRYADPISSMTYHRGFTHSLFVLTADRKSTRLNSSHVAISYAVFCLNKKNTNCRIETV